MPLPEIGYAGMRYDALSGMFYVTTRWYDPRSSVFMSQDPLGFGGGQTNLSEYCGDSPANATDPSGCAEDWLWGLAGPAQPNPAEMTARQQQQFNQQHGIVQQSQQP